MKLDKNKVGQMKKWTKLDKIKSWTQWKVGQIKKYEKVGQNYKLDK